jgi:hypothetical protein
MSWNESEPTAAGTLKSGVAPALALLFCSDAAGQLELVTEEGEITLLEVCKTKTEPCRNRRVTRFQHDRRNGQRKVRRPINKSVRKKAPRPAKASWF